MTQFAYLYFIKLIPLSPRPIQKLNGRVATVEFLVGTQGLATPTLQNLLAQTGILPSAFLLRL